MKRKSILSFLISTIISSSLILGFPKSLKADTLAAPEIQSKYAITVDVKTGEVIYSKDASSKAFPASITKLLTGLVLVDQKQPDDPIQITERALQVPPSALYEYTNLRIGNNHRTEDVLTTLLTMSANDLAETIATNIPNISATDSSEFMKLMNEKAKELGMNDSNFVTASGLDDNLDNHTTTAYDLSILTREAYSNERILAASRYPFFKPDFGNGELNLRNSNRFINGDFPVFTDARNIASKTGYTDKAGRCLASLFEQDGRQLVGVILFAPSVEASFQDMRTIIDYSYAAAKKPFTYKAFGSDKLVTYEKDADIGTVPVTYKTFNKFGPEKTASIDLFIKDDINIYENSFNLENTKVSYKLTGDPFRTNTDEPFGELTILEKETEIKVPVYSSINKQILKDKDSSSYTMLYLGIAGVVIILLILILLYLRYYNLKRRGNLKKSNSKILKFKK